MHIHDKDYYTEEYHLAVMEMKVAADREKRNQAVDYLYSLEKTIRQDYGFGFLNQLRQANEMEPYPE